MGSNLNLVSACKEIQDRLPSQDYTLGKGWIQTFNGNNSGTRKIMQGIQAEQRMQLIKSETAIISTGAENQFAELSSTFVRAVEDMVVINKIPKYDLSMGVKNSNYWLICLDTEHGIIHALERIDYRHISESYGFKMDTKYLDSLSVGDMIPKGSPIIKSNSYDCANNKCDGLNLTTVYMALAQTTEDPVVLSESAARKFAAPLFDTLPLQINDNDILLNLYGEGDNYKVLPDIGEEIKGGILCAVRRERKDDEALYSQSWDRLKDIMISDERYTLQGTVIDISVYCNNPEKLENSVYNQQIAKYYKMQMIFCRNVVKAMEPLISKGLKLTYDAEKLYVNCKDAANGKPYIKDKVFNNIYMEVVTMESKPLLVGDKIADRYAGKGVISEIRPDNMMPQYVERRVTGFAVESGKTKDIWSAVDAIYDSSTVVNRENPGQSFETEITFVGGKLLERIMADIESIYDDIYEQYGSTVQSSDLGIVERAEELILAYLKILAPVQEAEYQAIRATSSLQSRYMMLESMCRDGAIYLCIPPISGNMNIDKLKQLYDAFPFVEPSSIMVPQRGSNGKYRMIPARRRLITGKKYIYRLKQFAQEKLSSVSLASTNIRGENTKSKANKLHKTVHATTPVRFGEMEFEDLTHMQVELVIQTLMLLSSSPTGRRLMQQLLTGDPYIRDIKLDTDATSRSVEVVNAYLKTMCLKLIFERIPKAKGNTALREAVKRIPNMHMLTEIVSRVPHQLRDSIVDIARKRIIAEEAASGLIHAVDRVATGIKTLKNIYPEHDAAISEAVDEICRIAKEFNPPGEFNGYEGKKALIQRAINDKPKVILLPAVQRDAVERIYK